MPEYSMLFMAIGMSSSQIGMFLLPLSAVIASNFLYREQAFRAFKQEVELGHTPKMAFESSLAGAERFVGEAPKDD